MQLKPNNPNFNSGPNNGGWSILYSATETGFTASLIEKDYFCSLVLDYLFRHQTGLVFKGGTCLSKVYFDFYRLSEDLDFIIPIESNTIKSKRRSKITPC